MKQHDTAHGKWIFGLTWGFFAVLMVLAVLIQTAGSRFRHNVFEEPIHAMTTGWTMQQDGQSQAMDLPAEFSYGQSGACTFTTVLRDPGDLFASPVIRLISNHMDFVVTLDGQPIYNYDLGGMGGSKSPGNVYHYVRLPAGYEGETLTIQVQMLLGDSLTYTLETPLMGSKGGLLMHALRNELGIILVVLLILLFGVVTLGLTLLFKRQMGFSPSLFYTGIFAIVFGIYAFCETETLRYFATNTYLIYVTTFITLAFIPVPMMMICRDNVHPRFSKVLLLTADLAVLNVAVQLVGHFAGWFDLRSALIVTHGVVCVGIVMLLICILGSRPSQCPQRNRLLWSILPMLVGALIDLGLFYGPFVFTKNSMYFQIGVLLFVMIQLFYLALKYFALYRETIMADYYRRIAFIDVLTGLGNRRAFEQHIDEWTEQPDAPVYCVTCDINDLKWANDTLGHAQGDLLITDAAALLRDSFGAAGRAFRTGGDEFVVFVNLEEAAMQRALGALQGAMGAYNAEHGVALSLALGVKRYEPGGERTLLQALTESDRLMYENKNAQKGEQSTRMDPA